MTAHFSVILGLTNLFLVNSQYAQSPCPGVFDYQSDGFSVYGVIRLQPNGPVGSVFTRANFTVATRLTSDYVGYLEPVGSDLYLPEYQGAPITYRVHFPVTSPLPRVTSITANDNFVCYGTGDNPEQNQYVTPISLQHTLFQKPDTYGSGDFNQGSVPYDPYVESNYTQQQPPYQQPQNLPPPQPNHPLTKPNQTTLRLPYYNQYYPEQITEAAPLLAPPTPPSTQASIRAQLPADESCGILPGGNKNVPLIFNWPWLVAIYGKKRKNGTLSFNCGGTLISNIHVVTAAHCIYQKKFLVSLRDIVVKLGLYSLSDWGDEIAAFRTVVSASIHDAFNTTSLKNDIVVLTMGRSVMFNKYIRPACLWNGNTDQSRIIGALGILVGWGSTALDEAGQGEPRMLRIPIVGTSTCRASNAVFRAITSARTLCAGDRMGTGPCLGDSGTGLFLLEDGRWRLRGVTSISLRPASGETLCNVNEYSVFTDTAQYIKWIRSAMDTTGLD